MDKNELKEKLRFGMDKVVASSKKAFQKTETVVRKFSDQSVIRIEIKQFGSKRKEELRKLGLYAFEKFNADSSAVVSATEDKVLECMDAIRNYDKEIESRQEKLKALGEAPEPTDAPDKAE